MSEHYNAFISYRHKPADIKAAEEVQKQLERFVIPSEIRKKYGIQKIERVFRDKNELPTTSNLTADIEAALDNSDYLIVICSPDTKESRWVQREIDLFLEEHEQSRVLTVLAAGEPEDVIPERLLTEKRIITENGSPKEVMVPVEPLSTDYRMPFRKANKTELPRLASVIIGCTYDELMRRRQQYRMRRAALFGSLITAAALIGIAYLLWSRNEIRKNYLQAEENLRQSQISQSRYLSAQSQKAMENHDRVLAMQLALSAMPDEDTERPVIAEAQFALADAAGLYKAPGSMEYTSVKAYSAPAKIEQFLVSDDMKYMAARDSTQTVYLWDLQSGEKLSEKQYSDVRLYKCDDTGFFSVSSDHTDLISWEDGHTLLHKHCSASGYGFRYDPASGFATAYSGGYVSWFNTDGTVFETVDANGLYQEEGLTFSLARIFPDENTGVFVFSNSVFADERFCRVILYDLENRSASVLPKTFHNIVDVFVTENDTLLFCDDNQTMDTRTGYLSNTMITYYDMSVTLTAVDIRTRKERWSLPIHYFQSGVPEFEYLREYGYILCTLSNIQAAVNSETGDLIHRAEWPCRVANTVLYTEDTVMSFLADGKVAHMPLGGEDPDVTVNTLGDHLQHAERINPYDAGKLSVMALFQDSSQLIQYDPDLFSPGYRELMPLKDSEYLRSHVMSDRYLALNEFADDKYVIKVLDLSNDEIVYRESFESSLIDYGFVSDERLYLFDGEHGRLRDMKTGEETVFSLPEAEFRSTPVTSAFGDYIFFAYNSYAYADETLYAGRLNMITGEAEEFAAGQQPHSFSEQLYVLADGAYLLYVTNLDSGRYSAQIIDLQKKAAVSLPEEFRDKWLTPAGTDSFVAVRGDTAIRLYSLAGECIGELPQTMSGVLSFSVFDDDILILNGDGTLVRCSINGDVKETYGTAINKTVFSGSDSYRWNFDGDLLYLNANGVFQIIDLSQTQFSMYVPDALGYDRRNSRILFTFTGEVGSTSISAFHLYSDEEMVQTAEEMVGDNEISEDIKDLYGLN